MDGIFIWNAWNYISILPSELLRMIFLNCLMPDIYLTPDPLEVPLLLCRVCRQWRRIAICYPILWSSISIRNYGRLVPKIDSSNQVTLVPAKDNLRPRFELIKLWIERSKPMKLSIQYTTTTPVGRHDNYRYTEEAERVLDIIFNESHRWKYLSMSLEHLNNYKGIPKDTHAPFLQQLTVTPNWYHNIEHINSLILCKQLTQTNNHITHLSVHPLLQITYISEILATLSRTLEYCSFTDVSVRNPESTMDTSTLISLPRLLSLLLGSRSFIDTRVQQFQVNINAVTPYYILLARLVTPKLFWLELRDTVMFDRSAIEKWAKNSSCKLRRLSFTDAFCLNEIMPCWKDTTHGLEYLHIGIHQRTNVIPRSMYSSNDGLKIHHPTGMFYYCPGLQEISVDIRALMSVFDVTQRLGTGSLLEWRLAAPRTAQERSLKKIRITRCPQEHLPNMEEHPQVKRLHAILGFLGIWNPAQYVVTATETTGRFHDFEVEYTTNDSLENWQFPVQ